METNRWLAPGNLGREPEHYRDCTEWAKQATLVSQAYWFNDTYCMTLAYIPQSIVQNTY